MAAMQRVAPLLGNGRNRNYNTPLDYRSTADDDNHRLCVEVRRSAKRVVLDHSNRRLGLKRGTLPGNVHGSTT